MHISLDVMAAEDGKDCARIRRSGETLPFGPDLPHLYAVRVLSPA